MKIIRSKLQIAVLALVADLEQRDICGVEVSVAPTTLEGDPAYVLFIAKEGLYAALTLDREHSKHLLVQTMQTRLGDERVLEAHVQSIPIHNVLTISFIIANYFVERSRHLTYAQLWAAYPELDSVNHQVLVYSRRVDLTGFLHT